MTEPACLVVCVGKDCRTSPGFDELRSAAGRLDRVDEVPCQDLCHGPIVGLRIEGELRWYHRIRKGKQRAAILQAVESGHVGSQLRELELRKRRNHMRHAGKLRRLRAA